MATAPTHYTKPIATQTNFCQMEARRRLALLSSHLRPTADSSASPVLSFNCSSNFDSEKGNQEIDCIFCRIIRGESPALKAFSYYTKVTFSLPASNSTYLIGAMCSKVPFIGNAVVKATGCDSYNLLVNNGAAAGQVIFHTHLHIIPRKAQDCLWASESLSRRPLKLDHETAKLADRIRKELLFFNRSKDNEGQGSTLSTN